ncbi:MAG TPA: outer membrane lipoprotein chaperone LolA [Thermoanaerobaculia bacterium]|nr:outer membrane lipoprotein chaperone LolA [Thermoanaerobaculia bacterium]
MQHRSISSFGLFGLFGLVGLVAALAGCGGADRAPEPSDNDAAPIAVADPVPAQESPPLTSIPGDAGVPNGAAVAAADPAEAPAGARPVPGSESASPGVGSDAASTPAPAAQNAQADAGAGDLIERAERTYAQMRTLEADFVQEVYVPLLETTQHSQGKMYHRIPDAFAMRFTQPAGDVVVADGRHIWMYYPSMDDRQVMRAVLSPNGQQIDLHKEFLSDATSRFNVTRTGSETVAGRQTHAVTLLPRGPSPYRRVRLWVDAQDHLVRRFEITEENGTIRKVELRNLRPNATLADDLFRFTPPPGVQVHDF